MNIHIETGAGEDTPRMWEVFCPDCEKNNSGQNFLYAMLCYDEEFVFELFKALRGNLECAECGEDSLRIREKQIRGSIQGGHGS